MIYQSMADTENIWRVLRDKSVVSVAQILLIMKYIHTYGRVIWTLLKFIQGGLFPLRYARTKPKLLLTSGKVNSNRNCNQSDVGTEKEETPGRSTERPLGRDRSFSWGQVWVGSQECPEKHWLPMPWDTKGGALKETPVQAPRPLLFTLLASIY